MSDRTARLPVREQPARRTTPLADSLTTALRLRRATPRFPEHLPAGGASLPPAALRTLPPTHPGLPPAADRPAWAPCSPCGLDCLPAAGRRADPRAALRVARRLTALVALLLVALPVLLAGPNPRLFRAVLRAAGVRLRVCGTSYGEGGVLVVANHLSWIDVVALGAVAPVRMIAKREVADWPLIGPIARRTGALFVDRAGLRGLPAVVAGTAGALRGGAVVGVFPEGTTWCGSASGPFRRAPFQAALDAGRPVRPVRIDLTLPDGRPTTAGAFVGDETLWASLLRVLRLERLDCTLTLLPVLPPEGDRRTLAARAERAVAAA
ncbi:1-acyl-sn-glycerol-3-phosphate acyltransferase [Pseudonocardia sp. RS11V-5]|uniref:lysophospholipid acyltransferase family protein n=1 Tax=Pseudonocardia terrae TaxID=2905831 RepID=UPI001E3322A1|nr:lysophospholipid acyltransferase family protein [Pseudonocardia terrae]MCE3554946.1 1-acyl-sn-glycerol-3-phosphate acyltransferase [Pseudonocardia terrae]